MAKLSTCLTTSQSGTSRTCIFSRVSVSAIIAAAFSIRLVTKWLPISWSRGRFWCHGHKSFLPVGSLLIWPKPCGSSNFTSLPNCQRSFPKSVFEKTNQGAIPSISINTEIRSRPVILQFWCRNLGAMIPSISWIVVEAFSLWRTYPMREAGAGQ